MKKLHIFFLTLLGLAVSQGELLCSAHDDSNVAKIYNDYEGLYKKYYEDNQGTYWSSKTRALYDDEKEKLQEQLAAAYKRALTEFDGAKDEEEKKKIGDRYGLSFVEFKLLSSGVSGLARMPEDALKKMINHYVQSSKLNEKEKERLGSRVFYNLLIQLSKDEAKKKKSALETKKNMQKDLLGSDKKTLKNEVVTSEFFKDVLSSTNIAEVKEKSNLIELFQAIVNEDKSRIENEIKSSKADKRDVEALEFVSVLTIPTDDLDLADTDYDEYKKLANEDDKLVVSELVYDYLKSLHKHFMEGLLYKKALGLQSKELLEKLYNAIKNSDDKVWKEILKNNKGINEGDKLVLEVLLLDDDYDDDDDDDDDDYGLNSLDYEKYKEFGGSHVSKAVFDYLKEILQGK